jgi:asparagine synthase (glutamine-hydrolysing)
MILSVSASASDISSANLNNIIPCLGHRRLSIIDLSERGHCPMSDEDGKIWITYNGEIYNYIELREELKSHGYSFRTCSDTEVIIKSYQKWGEDCFGHFNGMWSFALWDSNTSKLILSRDRFGVKPMTILTMHVLPSF